MWFILLLLISTTAAIPTTSPSSITTTYLIYDSVLGGRCDSDTNCGGLVGNSMCLNGICVCQSGYRPEGDMNCIEGEDTTTLSSTTFIYDSVLGGPCNSDTNCQGLVGGSMCLDGICVCQPGFFAEGTLYCIHTEDTTTSSSTTFIYDSALGGACDSDTNCGGLVGNSMCLNGICVCQPGYRPEGDMNCVEGEDTTTSSSTTFIYDSVLGGPCDSDTNCQGLVGSSMCLDGICVCQPGFFAEGTLYCIHTEDTTTSSSTTSSSSTFIYDSALGGACDSDTNCGGLVGNSMCRNGICACRSGYRPEGNMKCVEGEGMSNLLF
ncbi:unnamed protein product [Rotaria sordida]|uniref:EB domain-containing protein n=1 Tax=Rotaria sordida TaxID=392033 RepID=A0A819BHA3_9BILA|nr:unnamed protein product [Rotaria sordida]